jgi:hypothetical protein
LNIIKNITVIFLSLMICYTSSGTNLFVHVCGEKISNLSLTETEDACGMQQLCKYLEKNHQTSIYNTNTCCKTHLLKTNVKVQCFENGDQVNLFHHLSKFSSSLFIQSYNLFVLQKQIFSDISPHNTALNLAVKKGIYLLFQNFRN